MQVKIQNAQLRQAADLLFHLSLKGKRSRHRTKFIKKLNGRLKEVEEQRVELAKEHSHTDENGEPKMKNDGKDYDIKDMEAFRKDFEELYNEEMIIEGGDNQEMLKTVKDVLFDCEKEWKGPEAMMYDYLCEQFEGVEESE